VAASGQDPVAAVTHGVQVWLPELDGPVDLTHPTHQALIMQLGERARREVARTAPADRPTDTAPAATLRADMWINQVSISGLGVPVPR
jgi:hypothetical protein